MDTVNQTGAGLLHLPDEILLYILAKLSRADVLFSLLDISDRLDRLVLERRHLRTLDFTILWSRSYDIEHYGRLIRRIREQILPVIHHEVHALTLGPISLRHVLHISDFPRLRSLTLMLDRCDTFVQQLQGDTVLRRLLRDQLEHLHLSVNLTDRHLAEFQPRLLALIMQVATRLTHLTLLSLYPRHYLDELADLRLSKFRSSTLTKLCIDVPTMQECLSLMDGRLECLSTLVISVKLIEWRGFGLRQPVLPKLKHFSLTSLRLTYWLTGYIVQLFRRMANLEQLTLFLLLLNLDPPYIDGTNLCDNVLVHMPRLNKLTFSITITIGVTYQTSDELSGDRVRRSLTDERLPPTACYVAGSREDSYGRCHIYSVPYAFDVLHVFASSFPVGSFDKVVHLIMNDIQSFEHELFVKLSQCCPLLRRVYLKNKRGQQIKRQPTTPLVFPHLCTLELDRSHVDYAEQFLLKSKACLPRLAYLHIGYETLVELTKHFTLDAAELNVGEVTTLRWKYPAVLPEQLRAYFPLL